jgi:hypothetical protein
VVRIFRFSYGRFCNFHVFLMELVSPALARQISIRLSAFCQINCTYVPARHARSIVVKDCYILNCWSYLIPARRIFMKWEVHLWRFFLKTFMTFVQYSWKNPAKTLDKSKLVFIYQLDVQFFYSVIF